ncbi:unnamed protein product [Arabis nemorensis]|uniref:Transcription initiation factor IIF subunit alpha n=1 Tax=Arabis nemorensis TaxID=586526 RepID=A0A565ASG0_9BRAS|nr:unnamed protein product [Arabis nemorensis]
MAICSKCGSDSDVGLTTCRHASVCRPCFKSMAINKEICSSCGVMATLWIQEFDVRLCPETDKNFFGATFGGKPLPDLKGHQLSLYKSPNLGQESSNKKEPWILKDLTSNVEYKGRHVNPKTTERNFFLIRQEDGSFVATPAYDCYDFERVRKECEAPIEQVEAEMASRKRAEAKMDKRIQSLRRNRNTEKPPPLNKEEEDSDGQGSSSGQSQRDDWDHVDSFSDDEEVSMDDIESTFLVSEDDDDSRLIMKKSKRRLKGSHGTKLDVKDDAGAAGPSEKITGLEGNTGDVVMENTQVKEDAGAAGPSKEKTGLEGNPDTMIAAALEERKKDSTGIEEEHSMHIEG